MHQNSAGRRSSTNPVRISTFEREDRSLSRTDQRHRSHKSKGFSIGETSHIPRPRFRSSSNDRLSGRKSYLKATGRTPLRQPTTPVTPARNNKVELTNLMLTSSNRIHTGISTTRSPSGERVSNVSAKIARRDTRPLTEKTYQTTLLNKIDDFFRANQCSGILNGNGSLKPITIKMFVEVSNYLLKYFSVKQDLTIVNYLEELPRSAKKLHYPGVITKSWLKTANTMHAWPCVLGWIGWLVEACQMRDIAFNRFQLEHLPFMGTQQQAQSCQMEFSALLESYRAWNEEKLDEEAALLEKYLRDVIIQQGVTEKDISQAHKELEQETVKLQAIEEESRKVDNEVERLNGVLSSLHAKHVKKLNDIKAKEDYIKKTYTETNQLNTEYNALNEQIRFGNAQHKELTATVQQQPMSKAEKEDILKNCTEIQNYIHEFDEHLKDYQKESYTLDIKLASVNNNLNKAVLAYNKEVFLYIDNDIGVNFDELKLPEKGLLNPQIMNILEEKAALIKSFKELLMKQCNKLESLTRSDILKLENLEERIKSLPDDAKLREERSQVNQMKTNAKKEKAKLMDQIKLLRDDIKEIQNTMPNVQEVELEIEEATDKLDAVARRKVFLEQLAKQFFQEFYKVLNEHRKELHDLLTRKMN